MSPVMELPVAFAGPTFVNRWTLPVYMGGALMRHPGFRLMALPRIGSVSVATSAKHYAEFVRREIGPRRPYIAAGQSQGGVVAALHALTDPWARHVVMLDSPLHGAWLSRLLLAFPAARELSAGSGSLEYLREGILDQPDRFTSVFCPQEQVMEPGSAYLPGITNILVGSARQLQRFAVDHPEIVPTETLVSGDPVTHTTAMRNPDVRRLLWQIASTYAEASGTLDLAGHGDVTRQVDLTGQGDPTGHNDTSGRAVA
jgi:pimeloyl-ACP methyl ester carboxylesterase